LHRFQKWRDALQVAPNVNAINALMRDYVAAIGVAVIDTLPAACRQALLQPDLDVQAAAVTLLQSEMSLTGATDELRALLHEIAHTFAAASVRITSLHGPAVAAS